MRLNGLHDGLLVAAPLRGTGRSGLRVQVLIEKLCQSGDNQSGAGSAYGGCCHSSPSCSWRIPVLPNRPEVISSYRAEAAALATAVLRAAASAACSLKHARTR
jgi:hypothetical protein